MVIKILMMIGLVDLVISFRLTEYLLEKIMYKSWGWIVVKLFTCYQCLGFWIPLCIYQDLSIALISSLLCNIWGLVKNIIK